MLSWYGGDSLGSLRGLSQVLNHGRLAKSGKLSLYSLSYIIFDGGVLSFSMNPDCYDPEFHFRVAIESQSSAFAAPLGLLEGGFRPFVGEIPIFALVPSQVNWDGSIMDNYVESVLQLGGMGLGLCLNWTDPVSRADYISEMMAWSSRLRRSGLVFAVFMNANMTENPFDGEGHVNILHAVQSCFLAGAQVVSLRVVPPVGHSASVLESQRLLIQWIRKAVAQGFDGHRILLFDEYGFQTQEELLHYVASVASGGGIGCAIGPSFAERPLKEIDELSQQIARLLLG
jgi:class I fructose-bisphosphate aldolase